MKDFLRAANVDKESQQTMVQNNWIPTIQSYSYFKEDSCSSNTRCRRMVRLCSFWSDASTRKSTGHLSTCWSNLDSCCSERLGRDESACNLRGTRVWKTTTWLTIHHLTEGHMHANCVVAFMMTEVFIHSFSRETNRQTCLGQQHKDPGWQDTQPRYWSNGIH